MKLSPKQIGLLVGAGLVAIVLLVVGLSSFKVIDAGEVGVATLFGDVVDESYPEGLHFPVNPFFDWTEYNVKEQKLDVQGVPVPTADQQTSRIDLTVIYELNDAACAAARGDVGNGEAVREVKIVPNMRSLVRSVGKSVPRCEDLFLDKIQDQMQTDLQVQLQNKVGKYVTIKAVLLRNIVLPKHILDAIKNKKVREQQGEEEKAELARFKTEQEQKKAQAQAERAAAEEKAEQIKVLADADAYAISAINKAIAGNPAYIKLQALKALEAISKDPASKLYFMDGNSPNPLPLLHLGDGIQK